MIKEDVKFKYENGEASIMAIKSEVIALSVNIVEVDHDEYNDEDFVIGFTKMNNHINWFKRKLHGYKFQISGITYNLKDFMYV